MITFLSLILLLGILLLFFKKHKTALGFLITFAIIFVMQGNGVIASFLLTKLQASYASDKAPSWKENNIILLLGAGTNKVPDENIIRPGIFGYSRILKTAQLYFSCHKSNHKCTIIISGGDVFNMGISEAENYRNNLVAMGIKEKDIYVETESKNTYQNAEFSSKILKEKKYDNLILVSSGLHLKRSLLYFANFNLFPQPIIADYVSAYSSYIPIGYNFALADLAWHEYEGILRLYIYNYMGWNKKDN